MLQDKVVYFFELVDFQASSPSDDIAQDDTSARVGGAAALLNPWKRIAWGFYRPNAPNANLDGSAAGSALARSRASSVSSVLSRGFSWRATRVAPGPANSYRLSGGLGCRAALQSELRVPATPPLLRRRTWSGGYFAGLAY